MKVSMDTKKVQEILRDNFEKYQVEYEKQLKGWQKAYNEYTDGLKSWASENKSSREKPSEPPKPQDFREDYEKLIEMLDAHEGKFLTLDEEDYKRVIRNQFGWSHVFLSNTSKYASH